MFSPVKGVSGLQGTDKGMVATGGWGKQRPQLAGVASLKSSPRRGLVAAAGLGWQHRAHSPAITVSVPTVPDPGGGAVLVATACERVRESHGWQGRGWEGPPRLPPSGPKASSLSRLESQADVTLPKTHCAQSRPQLNSSDTWKPLKLLRMPLGPGLGEATKPQIKRGGGVRNPGVRVIF